MSEAWTYDEFSPVGIDFGSPEEVAAYDDRQGNVPTDDIALLDRLGARAGQSLVDLGSGTGSLALHAAARGMKVHAVDVSPAMLAIVRGKADSAGLDTISCHQAGFLTYEHPSPGADFVVSRFALHHLSDFWKGVALLRIASMLRPGGQALVRDVVFSFPLEQFKQGIEAWIADVAREDGRGWPRSAFETHVREEHSTFGWIMEGLIERSGLRLVAAEYESDAYAEFLCRKPA
jgi:putative AdoMet-dependent methyltransferase